MQFLKDNKVLSPAFIGTLLLIPVFLLHFDSTVMHWTSDFHKNSSAHATVDALRPLINVISNGATLIISAFFLCLFGRYKNPKLYELGRSLFISLVSSGLLVQILKHLLGRARPRLTYDLVFIGPSLKNGYDSFPSGHTTLAFCLAFIVSKYYPRYGVVFYLFAVAVGLYRVDGFAHFPSDVVAGALIGTVVAKLIYARTIRQGGQASCRE